MTRSRENYHNSLKRTSNFPDFRGARRGGGGELPADLVVQMLEVLQRLRHAEALAPTLVRIPPLVGHVGVTWPLSQVIGPTIRKISGFLDLRLGLLW